MFNDRFQLLNGVRGSYSEAHEWTSDIEIDFDELFKDEEDLNGCSKVRMTHPPTLGCMRKHLDSGKIRRHSFRSQ